MEGDQSFATDEEPHRADRLWILITEYDLGDRDEESIREELRALRVAA